jgi:hypothetical protein
VYGINLALASTPMVTPAIIYPCSQVLTQFHDQGRMVWDPASQQVIHTGPWHDRALGATAHVVSAHDANGVMRGIVTRDCANIFGKVLAYLAPLPPGTWSIQGIPMLDMQVEPWGNRTVVGIKITVPEAHVANVSLT